MNPLDNCPGVLDPQTPQKPTADCVSADFLYYD